MIRSEKWQEYEFANLLCLEERRDERLLSPNQKPLTAGITQIIGGLRAG
jgi:hypothetical protein